MSDKAETGQRIQDEAREQPDEEFVPHAFRPRAELVATSDGPMWCVDCAYHRDSPIHLVASAPLLKDGDR